MFLPQGLRGWQPISDRCGSSPLSFPAAPAVFSLNRTARQKNNRASIGTPGARCQKQAKTQQTRLHFFYVSRSPASSHKEFLSRSSLDHDQRASLKGSGSQARGGVRGKQAFQRFLIVRRGAPYLATSRCLLPEKLFHNTAPLLRERFLAASAQSTDGFLSLFGPGGASNS